MRGGDCRGERGERGDVCVWGGGEEGRGGGGEITSSGKKKVPCIGKTPLNALQGLMSSLPCTLLSPPSSWDPRLVSTKSRGVWSPGCCGAISWSSTSLAWIS